MTAPGKYTWTECTDTRHTCAFFSSDNDEYRGPLSFMKDGFDCADKAIHVVNPDQRIDILRTHSVVIVGGIRSTSLLIGSSSNCGRVGRGLACAAPRRADVAGRREAAAEEVARLQGCLNDLVSITALLALWAGGEPPQIAGTLLDALLEMLRLAFVFSSTTTSPCASRCQTCCASTAGAPRVGRVRCAFRPRRAGS